ncbi:MAG: peroxidase family protein [Alphaproteobacteria bacterium]
MRNTVFWAQPGHSSTVLGKISIWLGLVIVTASLIIPLPAYAGRSFEPFRSWLPDFAPTDAQHFSRLFPVAAHVKGRRARGLSEQRSPFRALDELGHTMVEGSPDSPAGDSEIPAGYTYLGQFIDHDATFDVATQLGEKISSDAQLENGRTPELDLDNVYGGGPLRSPHLYNLPYLRVGKRITGGSFPRYDLYRTPDIRRHGPQGGRSVALIGDPRDDENFIISQLHAAFVAFHNRTADILVRRYYGEGRTHFCRGDKCEPQAQAANLPDDIKMKIFKTAREHVIHYYHRIIAEDYLPRIIGEGRVADLMAHGRDFFYPRGFRDDAGQLLDVAIPVEFAAAAFRFGQSQVRESYQLNRKTHLSIFGSRKNGHGLHSFEPVKKRYLVNWRYFFDIAPEPPEHFNYARRIAPRITPALFRMGIAYVPGMGEVTSLPARNLMRGRGWRLPVAQDVAEHVLPVLEKRGVFSVPPRKGSKHGKSWEHYLLPPDQRTTDFLRDDGTPLWYYILQEAYVFGTSTRLQSLPRFADKNGDDVFGAHGPVRMHPVAFRRGGGLSRGPRRRRGGHRLGPVGGTIVGEVLTGLLEHYREKTGKGLDYRPKVIGSTSLFGTYEGDAPPVKRYLMRNLLLDAGVARP